MEIEYKLLKDIFSPLINIKAGTIDSNKHWCDLLEIGGCEHYAEWFIEAHPSEVFFQNRKDAKKIYTDILSRNIIGYKLKEGFNIVIPTMQIILGYKGPDYPNLKTLYLKDRAKEIYSLKTVNLLEAWFEPIYKEKQLDDVFAELAEKLGLIKREGNLYNTKGGDFYIKTDTGFVPMKTAE